MIHLPPPIEYIHRRIALAPTASAGSVMQYYYSGLTFSERVSKRLCAGEDFQPTDACHRFFHLYLKNFSKIRFVFQVDHEISYYGSFN